MKAAGFERRADDFVMFTRCLIASRAKRFGRPDGGAAPWLAGRAKAFFGKVGQLPPGRRAYGNWLAIALYEYAGIIFELGVAQVFLEDARGNFRIDHEASNLHCARAGAAPVYLAQARPSQRLV